MGCRRVKAIWKLGVIPWMAVTAWIAPGLATPPEAFPLSVPLSNHQSVRSPSGSFATASFRPTRLLPMADPPRANRPLWSGVYLATAQGQAKPEDPAQAPSPWWLIVMPAIPIVGGGFIYLKRRLLPVVPATAPSPAESMSGPNTVPLSETEIQETSPPPRRSRPLAIAIFRDYFPLIGIASVTVVSFVTYVVMRNQLTTPVLQDLQTIADEKEQELDTWFATQRDALLEATTLADTLPDIEKLLAPPDPDIDYEDIQAEFADYLATLPAFQGTDARVALLTSGGIVTYATDPEREGQYQPLQNTTTYITSSTTNALPNLYVSPLTDALQITFATPILSEDGDRLGVFSVDLDLADLASAIAELPASQAIPTVAATTSHSIYLVGRASLVKNQVISPTDDFQNRYPDGVNSRGINTAIGRLNGSGLYLNYAKTPVIGVYRWAPQHNLALLAEVAQAEIFQPARIMARRILGVGFAVTGIFTLLLLWRDQAKRKAQAAAPSTAFNAEQLGSNSPDS